jgi:hypothetical protein
MGFAKDSNKVVKPNAAKTALGNAAAIAKSGVSQGVAGAKLVPGNAAAMAKSAPGKTVNKANNSIDKAVTSANNTSPKNIPGNAAAIAKSGVKQAVAGAKLVPGNIKAMAQGSTPIPQGVKPRTFNQGVSPNNKPMNALRSGDTNQYKQAAQQLNKGPARSALGSRPLPTPPANKPTLNRAPSKNGTWPSLDG